MKSLSEKLYKTKKIGYFEIIDYEFSKNLVDYIKNYNQLDQNVGLTLAWLVTGSNPRLAYPMISKLSAHGKMEALQKVISEKFSESSEEMVNEFDQWFSKASKTRTERNQYIHGYWQLAGNVNDKPIMFSPIRWEISNNANKNRTQYFSVDEFKAIVDELKAVCSDFGDLRRKYPF